MSNNSEGLNGGLPAKRVIRDSDDEEEYDSSKIVTKNNNGSNKLEPAKKL